MNTLWYFEDVNLFKILCPHKFGEYRKNHTFDKYGKNDYIYFEEDNSNKVYLIDKGKVKIGYYTERGDEIVQGILSRGEIFGEKAVLGEESRHEFAKSADKETSVCRVTATTMEELIKSDETFSIKFYKFLGYRFQKLERRLKLLLFKDTKTRLLEFMYELKEDFGNYCEMGTGDIIIKHPYTQSDIASLIGASRPTLNALLNELKADETLTFKRREIRLREQTCSGKC